MLNRRNFLKRGAALPLGLGAMAGANTVDARAEARALIAVYLREKAACNRFIRETNWMEAKAFRATLEADIGEYITRRLEAVQRLRRFVARCHGLEDGIGENLTVSVDGYLIALAADGDLHLIALGKSMNLGKTA